MTTAGSEPSAGGPPLPTITIQDLRTALDFLAPHSSKLMVDYFVDWLEEQTPPLSGVALAKEILAIGAHLLTDASGNQFDRLVRSSG